MTQIPVCNPRTGQVDYTFNEPEQESLFIKVAQLRSSQKNWCRRSVAERGQILGEFATALNNRREPLAEALSIDTGRWNLSLMEIDALQGITRNRINQAIDVLAERRTTPEGCPVSHLQVYVPFPVVAVISPWNYPLILSFLDAVPALLAGCSVIIKPSEITPRFIEIVHTILADVPELESVVEILAGTRITGESLISLTDAVNFTGSVETGRRVAASAASQLKPAFLELGGKDPAIVLRGADLEDAAGAIMHCAVVNTGQACFSIERVYVHESQTTEFIDRMCTMAEGITLNHEDIRVGDIGPFISARQASIAESHLADAVKKGARVKTGGRIERYGGGYWLHPTVVTEVDHSMLLMTNETFSPIVPIMAYTDEQEAINLANDSEFGLSASVFGEESDVERVGLQLESGGIYCNDVDLIGSADDSAEKMSFKHSGLGGSRYGPEGLTRFTRTQSLVFQHGQPTSIHALS